MSTELTHASSLQAVNAVPSVRPGNALVQTCWLAWWNLRRQTAVLPLMIVIQVLMSVATVVGYGFLVGNIRGPAALYLATGAPTVTLLTVGLVMAPQMVGMARTEGSYDWLRTLPVPRMSFLIADVMVWTLIALPGMVLGLFAGMWRFEVTLHPAWWLVPACLLVSLTAASVGYAMAVLLRPQLAHLLTQVLIFVVMLFSPVSFPADRMPGWLQHAHQWLPFEPMAQLVRAGLDTHTFTMPTRSLVLLLVWCIAALIGAAWALKRRD